MGTSKNVQIEILIAKRPEENPESDSCVFVSTHMCIFVSMNVHTHVWCACVHAQICL